MEDRRQTLAAFGARARDDVDLEDLTAQLLRVVDETMHPASAALWLKPVGTQPRWPAAELPKSD